MKCWPAVVAAAACAESWNYTAEWRLMEAGQAQIAYAADSARLTLTSRGFVEKLYRVRNEYKIQFNDQFCASSSLLKAEEGRKRRETKVTYQPPKASYLEVDTLAQKTIRQSETEIPECVHDVLAGLAKLRRMPLKPGDKLTLPISDGRKSAAVRVEVQKEETINTPAGVFSTIRCEARIFNNVIYRRKGRVFVWLTGDARRVPVQVRIQLPFWLGTITLKLEKETSG